MTESRYRTFSLLCEKGEDECALSVSVFDHSIQAWLQLPSVSPVDRPRRWSLASYKDKDWSSLPFHVSDPLWGAIGRTLADEDSLVGGTVQLDEDLFYLEDLPQTIDEFVATVESVFGDECAYRTKEYEDEFEWERVLGWHSSTTVSCARYKPEWVVADGSCRGEGKTFEDAAKTYFIACGVDSERAAAMAAGDFDDDSLEDE